MPSTWTSWTEDALATLRASYGQTPTCTLAAQLKRSISAVHQMAYHLGLKYRKRRPAQPAKKKLGERRAYNSRSRNSFMRALMLARWRRQCALLEPWQAPPPRPRTPDESRSLDRLAAARQHRDSNARKRTASAQNRAWNMEGWYSARSRTQALAAQAGSASAHTQDPGTTSASLATTPEDGTL